MIWKMTSAFSSHRDAEKCGFATSKAVFLISLLILFSIPSLAGPARRGIFTRLQPDGTEIKLQLLGDAFTHTYATPEGRLVQHDSDGFYRVLSDEDAETWRAEAFRSRSRALRATGRRGGSRIASYRMKDFPATGNVHGVVLLVAFADVAFCTDSATTHDLLAARYNGKNHKEEFNYSFYSPAYKDTFSVSGTITGSARDYFRDQSLGKFTPTFDVFGPITLDNNRIYYGGNERNGKDTNARGMIKDACRKAYELGLTDFSDYDNDGDGFVDYVYVVYAGNDEAQYGPEECVWAHSWTLASPMPLGDVKISSYACSGELLIDSKDVPAGIGTFVHEFGHVIGLPDFYNTALRSSELDFCLDYWSVMDYGLYCLDGYNPAGYTSFERYSMGWIPACNLDTAQTITLMTTDEDPVMYRTFVNENDTTSFYVFENIQRTGWNTNKPDYGLMISCVNYKASAWTNNAVNTDKAKHRYHVVPANNNYSYKDESNQLYGKNNYEFSTESTPASITQFGDTLNKPVTRITRTEGGSCTFDFMGGYDAVFSPLMDAAEGDDIKELYRINDHIAILQRGKHIYKAFVR